MKFVENKGTLCIYQYNPQFAIDFVILTRVQQLFYVY